MGVLCIGELLIDFTPYEGKSYVYAANPGGAPANVAVSVRRNGMEAGFLGKVGDDDFGDLLLRTLDGEKVDILCPDKTKDATTTMAFVTLAESGERTFTFARKPGADLLLSKADVEAVDFAKWDIIHAGSVSQSADPEREAVRFALKKAKENGKIVSFDINYRSNIWSVEECKAEVAALIDDVDLLKISEEELCFIDGSIPEYMLAHGITVVVLTKGGDGSEIFFGDEVITIPCVKTNVVDTTGAGDAYWGAFLASLMKQGVKKTEDLTGEILTTAGKTGAVSGALCVERFGGIPALPYEEEIARAFQFNPGTQSNIEYCTAGARELLEFGKQFPSPQGGSYYLGDDGTPMTERARETWITCRMLHVYSIGAKAGIEGCKELAEKALAGLYGELKDVQNGGWYPGITASGEILPGKQCYAHAFVILATSSAYYAGIEGAKELLDEALAVYDKYFWDEEIGLSVDTWNTEFTVLDDYRGINANMHTVEAFLAAADVLGDEKYRIRAGRIIEHVIGWAKDFDYRLPEHFSKDWTVMPELNKERPDDPFKPYGATPGHGIEWARLIMQWAFSTYGLESEEAKKYIKVAEKLYQRAKTDGWNADGEPGFVYTTDWDGTPVVHDRMHWTLAEAINTSAILARFSSDYLRDYACYLTYFEEKVHDHVYGSWYHQLDEHNQLKGTVWPGKSDLYHAFQAMLIPNCDPAKSIALEGWKLLGNSKFY